MAQDYDVTTKVLVKNFPQDYVRLVFKNEATKIELLNVELPAAKHYTDVLVKVTVAGETFIFHLEFFSSHEKVAPARMHGYSARIAAIYPELGIYGVALYLNEEDRDKPFPDFYEKWILGERRSYHKFDVIKVWELAADDVLRQQIIGLLPVIALMKHKQDATEKDIRAAIDLVQQKVEDAGLRAEMFAALYLFSGLKQLRALVKKLLTEANMLELLKKSESYQEILAEGREEGGAKSFIRSILVVLQARFGDVPDELSKQLQGLAAAQLDGLVAKAVTIESLAAFKALLHDLKAQPENSSARNGQNL
jgi:predicted transposase YdaD